MPFVSIRIKRGCAIRDYPLNAAPFFWVDAEGGKGAIASDMFHRYFDLALISAHKQYSLAPTCLFLLIVVSQTDAVNGIFTSTVLRPTLSPCLTFNTPHPY